jgi:hypothetical protein
MAQLGSGAGGAGIWIIAVHGLPTAHKAARGDLEWSATTQRVLGVIGVVSFYLVLGAFAAFVISADTAKESFAWGLGWQGVFGQYTRSRLDAAASR